MGLGGLCGLCVSRGGDVGLLRGGCLDHSGAVGQPNGTETTCDFSGSGGTPLGQSTTGSFLVTEDTAGVYHCGVHYRCIYDEEEYTADGTSGDVVFFKGDIDIEGIEDEAFEDQVGGFMGVGAPRRRISLSVDNAGELAGGKMVLALGDGENRVNVFTAAQGGQELYVEGAAGSAALKDVKLDLGFKIQESGEWRVWEGDEGEDQGSLDTVRFTVLHGQIWQDDNGNVADITDTTHSEIVGKKMDLTGYVKPSGVDVTAWQWNIPGLAIADYYADDEVGEVTDLTDLTSNQVVYYWVDGANGRDVTFTATAEGVEVKAMATIDVKRPTSTLTATTHAVLVNDPSGPGYDYGLWFGNPDVPDPQDEGYDVGIFFKRTIDWPPRFTGSTCFVQKCRYSRRLRCRVPPGIGCWMRLSLMGFEKQFPCNGYDADTPEDTPMLQLVSSYDTVEVNGKDIDPVTGE